MIPMTKIDKSPYDHVVDHDCACKSALQSAENHCKKQGVRLTAIRKQILQLMYQSHHAVKAYDLLEEIKSDFKNAKPVTIYRALDFLLKEGFIHKVESLNAFIACNQGHCNYECVLLICTQCHEVEEQTGSNMSKTVTTELQKSSFISQIKIIEIQGICVNCVS